MPEIVNTNALQQNSVALDSSGNTSSMIRVDHVSMSFNVANQQLNSLKEYAISLVRHELVFKEFKALDDIAIDVKKGDVYGILGTNGSGKSTLLKIIAGVLSPTKGSVEINGNIAPLIELGAGFDHELTARENIYLNGSLLGYSKAFIDEHFDEIVSFAEISNFLDMPLKNYSSGMVARIAFAIATVIVPDILIVDEVLSVGDFMFQQKCEERIQSLINEHGTTVLIVSHSNDQIERLCNKAIWIEKGHTRLVGSARDVCQAYRALGGHVGSAISEKVIFDTLKTSLPLDYDMIEVISSENRFGLNSKAIGLSPSAEKASTAIITLSDDYQVRLIATALASALNGVNIITKENELPDAAFSSLSRLRLDNILILERGQSIGDSVVKEIKTAAKGESEPTIIRNTDLSELSILAFEYACEKKAHWGKKVFLASLESIYASSAIASFIHETTSPVFFSDKAAPLDEEALQTLEKNGLEEVLLLDCPDSVASEWNRWAKRHALPTTEILGSNAIEAAFCATEWVTKNKGEEITHLVISPQDNLSYTYSAIPYAANKQSVSLVVNHNDLDSMAGLIDYISKHGSNISKVTVVGGEYLFSNVDRDIIAKAIAQAKHINIR